MTTAKIADQVFILFIGTARLWWNPHQARFRTCHQSPLRRVHLSYHELVQRGRRILHVVYAWCLQPFLQTVKDGWKKVSIIGDSRANVNSSILVAMGCYQEGITKDRDRRGRRDRQLTFYEYKAHGRNLRYSLKKIVPVHVNFCKEKNQKKVNSLLVLQLLQLKVRVLLDVGHHSIECPKS